MQLKNLINKIFLTLVFLLVSSQAWAQNSPQYTWRLNQLFVNPSSSSGPTTIRSPELYAKASIAAATTDGALIAAVAGKKIRVVSLVISPGTTATVSTFNSKPAGAGVAISAPIYPAANQVVPLPFNPAGWFETASGEGLTVTTSAGATTGYQITYVAY